METFQGVIIEESLIDRTSGIQYEKAREYGIALGIPPHQVDFAEEVVKSI